MRTIFTKVMSAKMYVSPVVGAQADFRARS